MSFKYGTSLVPSAYHYGMGGLGVRGDAVPSTGPDGPSCLWWGLTLPGDAAVEVRGSVTRFPTGGTFVLNENGSFSYLGPSDYFLFLGYADGVALTDDIGYGAGISRVDLNWAGATASGTLILPAGVGYMGSGSTRSILPAGVGYMG